MNKRKKPLYKFIWCKIRYYQKLNDMSNWELASCIGVSERTLLEYDKNAGNITLSKLNSFLESENMDIEDLLLL